MLQEIKTLVQTLNKQRDAYYNRNSPTMTDKEYDRLFDRLTELEKESGIVFSNSPTQSVGYYPVSELKKVRHPRALLSLEKTKKIQELADFMENQDTLLMLKLDGLTVKLVYEEGRLVQASTRGDGDIGEDITHNIPAFENVPLSISYKERLVAVGEAFIYKDVFQQLKDTVQDGNGEPYKNARNLASGSARNLNPEVCKGRHINFIPFNVLEGLDGGEGVDSREFKLMQLAALGFDICPYVWLEAGRYSEKELSEQIGKLEAVAGEKKLPIDGLVLIYDNLSYSAKCGRTGHHYKDGLAYKFEDETYETSLQEIEWTPSRSGDLAPVAVFDPVEIDGADVSRASLHNLSFIKNLELVPGCRILVSKRNMIIPHIEDNLDRGFYYDTYPVQCPCCGSPTRIRKGRTNKGKVLETLHCDNPECDSQILKKYVHFVAKKAMDISGLSESNLRRFLECGWLTSFQDIYHLDRYRKEMIALEGYGEKSYEKLWTAINESRNTDFIHYLTAMDIPMVGRTKSRVLCEVFEGSLDKFEKAAIGNYDFSKLEDFGDTLNRNIHTWFADEDNLSLWRNLQMEMNFRTVEIKAAEEELVSSKNPFQGCTIVATGKLMNFTRDGINSKIYELGGKPGSSVSKNTDYLICGEKAGSKLAKARSLGVTILSETEFLDMIA
ncbi:MAG: NAD-dependent DNA ligase LigA [Dorea sp.]|nr:NAD-dependent DNA ligase LigA [Dorea sp.]